MNQSWLSKSISLFILAAMAGFFITPAALSAGEPDPESILNSFRDSFRWTDHIEMHLQASEMFSWEPDVTMTWDLDLFNDGDSNFRTVGVNQEIDSSTKMPSKVDGGYAWNKSFQTLFSEESVKGLYLHYTHSDEGQQHYNTLDVWEAGEERRHIEKTKKQPFSAIFGYAPQFSEKAVYELLTPDNTTLREGFYEGAKSYILQAEVDEGHIEIWLSPDQGFVMQKCVLTKEAGKHLSADRTELYGEPGKVYHIAQKRCVTEITVHGIKEIDNTFIPLQLHTHYRHELENDQKLVRNTECVISNVNLNPDFEALGAFHFAVPEDTSVDFIKKDGTELTGFTWEDGKLIAPMDEQFVDTKLLEGLAAIHTTPSDNTKAPAKLSLLVNKLDSDAAAQMKEELWLYILTAAGVIVLIIGWIAYRMVKRRRGSK